MPQRDFSHVAFKGLPRCLFARMYYSPHENICQGVKVLFSLGPREARPVPLYAIWGTPAGHFFDCTSSRCACIVTVQSLSGHFAPQVGPETRHGAQKVPQRSPKALFSEPPASLLPAVATKSALCANIFIYDGLDTFYGSAPLPFRLKIDSGTHCVPEAVFFILLCPLLAPK